MTVVIGSVTLAVLGPFVLTWWSGRMIPVTVNRPVNRKRLTLKLIVRRRFKRLPPTLKVLLKRPKQSGKFKGPGPVRRIQIRDSVAPT